MRLRSTLLVALGALVGCGAPPVPPVHVTVLGIDGAAWRVIDPLLAEGALPSLQGLIDTGVRAPLRSELPLISPPVWTTVATGVRRRHHGIRNFNAPGGRLALSTDRRAPTLWTLASAAGLRSAVVGWWVTYPAEAIDGVVVSERALKVRDEDLAWLFKGRLEAPAIGQLVSPPDVLPVVADLLRQVPETDGPGDEPDAARVRMRAEDAAVVRTLARLRKRSGPFALEMALVRGVDVVSHHYWKFHEPDAAVYRPRERPSPGEVAAHGDVIRAYYRYVDRLLGELGPACPVACAVIVLSDHGFEAGRQPFRHGTLSGTHKSEAAAEGILIANGGPFRRGARLDRASILDVAPTVLHLLGLPVAESLEGEVLAEALDPEWMAARPVRRVARYPGPAVLAAPPQAPAAEERLEAELRALGYVE